MHWFLIIWLSTYAGGLGIDPGINPGYMPPAPTMHKILMPSQEVCEQIRDLNKADVVECWATPDTHK